MAFGSTHSVINICTISESWIFLQDIPTLTFSVHYQDPSYIADKFKNGNPALIIKNDAVIITGVKMLQTFDYLEVAEFSAKSMVMNTPMGKMTPINDQQVEDLRKVFRKGE